MERCLNKVDGFSTGCLYWKIRWCSIWKILRPEKWSCRVIRCTCLILKHVPQKVRPVIHSVFKHILRVCYFLSTILKSCWYWETTGHCLIWINTGVTSCVQWLILPHKFTFFKKIGKSHFECWLCVGCYIRSFYKWSHSILMLTLKERSEIQLI